MSKFERELRYVVTKIKDAKEALSEDEFQKLIDLANKVDKYRTDNGRHPMECVITESDWPNYENVWDSIEFANSKDFSDQRIKYCYSLNKEDFEDDDFECTLYNTKEEALNAAESEILGMLTDNPQKEVFIGKAEVLRKESIYPNFETISEHMRTEIECFMEEDFDDHFCVDKKAERDLEDKIHNVIDVWCNKHNIYTNFYNIESIERYCTNTKQKL